MNYYTSIKTRIGFGLLIFLLLILLPGILLCRTEAGGCFADDFVEVLMSLGRHSSFRYLNHGVLSNEFFDEASDTLDDNAVYLILSNTETASSRLISLFTKKDFNHISLSFDKELKTAVSYNGGNNVFPPGLNPERAEDFIRKEDSSALVYRLEVTRAQKTVILERISEINTEGSSYNIIGLVLNKSMKPNIMFCSQFVYSVLNQSGAVFFPAGKQPLKPSDFIELDYHRSLKFCYELKFCG